MAAIVIMGDIGISMDVTKHFLPSCASVTSYPQPTFGKLPFMTIDWPRAQPFRCLLCLSFCLCRCLYNSVPVCLSICLPDCLSVCLHSSIHPPAQLIFSLVMLVIIKSRVFVLWWILLKITAWNQCLSSLYYCWCRVSSLILWPHYFWERLMVSWRNHRSTFS